MPRLKTKSSVNAAGLPDSRQARTQKLPSLFKHRLQTCWYNPDMSEVLPGQELQADKERLMLEFLKSRGFRRTFTADMGIAPPSLQPGSIAPPGNTGDSEVRRRVINHRKRARGFPEI